MKPAVLLTLTLAAVVAGGCRGEQRASNHPAPPPPAPAAQPAAAPLRGTVVPKPIDAPAAQPPAVEPIARDLPEIRERRELRVLFTFNTTGYFIYRGQTMGYEYDLLSLFAKESGLRLKPVVVRDSGNLFERLNAGDGDVVAAQLAASASEQEVLMSDQLYATAPVVVQRDAATPAAGTTPTVERATAREGREAAAEQLTIRARLVSTPAELAGRQVHLSRVSPYRRRLLELNTEIADDIEVVEVDESTDKLIQNLAHGDIAYTVAAENVAALRAFEYTNLVIKPAIGPPQPVVWAMRRNAPLLHEELDRWLAAKRQNGLLDVLYRKYFEDRRAYLKRATSDYLTAETGRLSPYDDTFREHSPIPGWDWRLIAAQSYQESRFDPRARSWAGAIGLMQIMPRTARELRVDPRDPEQSVEGACRYLSRLDRGWLASIPDSAERLKFDLASYNVGMGHVQDAVRLAQKNGDDATSWENVAYWLIRKSKRAVYNDPVVKYGFARGTEPVGYVDSILGRWDHYRELTTDDFATVVAGEGG